VGTLEDVIDTLLSGTIDAEAELSSYNYGQLFKLIQLSVEHLWQLRPIQAKLYEVQLAAVDAAVRCAGRDTAGSPHLPHSQWTPRHQTSTCAGNHAQLQFSIVSSQPQAAPVAATQGTALPANAPPLAESHPSAKHDTGLPARLLSCCPAGRRRRAPTWKQQGPSWPQQQQPPTACPCYQATCWLK
jgi:hypothetical protein